MLKEQSFDELTTRVKFAVMLDTIPGFFEATTAFMAGITNYRRHCEKKLARMILGRDPILTDDIEREGGTITAIGGLESTERNSNGMPIRFKNDLRVEYGIFGTPVRIY